MVYGFDTVLIFESFVREFSRIFTNDFIIREFLRIFMFSYLFLPLSFHKPNF